MRARTADGGLHENSTDSIDHEVEREADSTAALTEAADTAEHLAAALRELATGRGFAASAHNDVDRLQEIVPTLRNLHHQYLASKIPDAAGNATSHSWVAGNVDLLCSACHCSALPRALRLGRVPVCGDWCSVYGGHQVRHSSYLDDQAACLRCKTVYPSTAPEGGAR